MLNVDNNVLLIIGAVGVVWVALGLRKSYQWTRLHRSGVSAQAKIVNRSRGYLKDTYELFIYYRFHVGIPNVDESVLDGSQVVSQYIYQDFRFR